MEIIAVIFSLLSVWLTARKNIWCWPVGIIGILAYSFIFFDKCNWGNFGLQFIFLVQSAWGWKTWKENNGNPSKLDNIERFNIIFATSVTATMVYILSSIFNGSFLILDSITTSLSIYATFLLGIKKIESWVFWIIADILYVVFFILNGLYLSSVLYFIFLILALYGFLNWKNN